jgi:O-acetylhomoserine (thiol)-lyase
MQQQTLGLHYGYNKDIEGAMSVPIYQTTAYKFRDTTHASNLFELKELGNIYTRLMNPTTDVYEKRFASLEGGVASIGTASGMSAIFYAIANVAEAGDNIIIAKQVYGGTTTLTNHTIKRFGIESRYFDIENPKELEGLIDDKSKIIIFESITNPNVTVADFDVITEIANRYNILTCVDNTVATPIHCKPLELGCDIVLHSTSKYTVGQGSALGGIIVEGLRVKDKIIDNPRYYHFNEPDESYHGLIYTKLELPPFTTRVRLSLLRDLGSAPSPFNSWLHIQGLETLAIRMREHSYNALKVAEFLESHIKVKKVNYPGLKSDRFYNLAQKYFNGGCSGLLSFELENREIATNMANRTKLFSLVVNIGDSKSIITHPASTTHQQLSSKELMESGISGGLVRLSVGLEDANDLINDLAQALEQE